MLNALGGDPEFLEPSVLPIPEHLNRLLAEGFEQNRGCILLRSLASSKSSVLPNLKDDETGIEAFINHIHLEDFVSPDVSFFELARLGCDFGFALRTRLGEEQLSGPFRVIVSARAADPASDGVHDTCVVRFHKRRPNQPWLDDELESYRDEAIAVMDF